jgi:hypothetical protein
VSDDAAFEGGCHCGALRYRIRVVPADSGYCHCRICQRTTGAPVLAWTSIPIDSFEYAGGAPKVYRSSANGQREFCASCGAQIAFRKDSPADAIDVNTATLDEPGKVHPKLHIWTASRIDWFETADDLPRFDREEPEPAPD